MKVSKPPEQLERSQQGLERFGEEVCGRITESSARDIGAQITHFFSCFEGDPQLDVRDFDRFVAALGFVFARCAEVVSNWKLEWLCLSEEDNTDGVYILVDSRRSFLVYPIGLIRSDFLRITHKSESFFKMLAAGKITPSCEGSFKEYLL